MQAASSQARSTPRSSYSTDDRVLSDVDGSEAVWGTARGSEGASITTEEASTSCPSPIQRPRGRAGYSSAWVRRVEQALVWAASGDIFALQRVFSVRSVCGLLTKLAKILEKERTLVEVQPAEGQEVLIVGDIHGQFHDVVKIFETAGRPSTNRIYVFNGDFVDRGAWGIEVLLLLAAHKLAAPKSVVLLRGDHESITCTALYGFKAELCAKFSHCGVRRLSALHAACHRLFAALPLAALVNKRTLCVHGGLFRKPVSKKDAAASAAKNEAKPGLFAWKEQPIELGSLADLRASCKGGPDPDGHGDAVLPTDVLWSDPHGVQGLRRNKARGYGLVWGPDVTDRFLRDNEVALVIRSHESPNAREYRRTVGLPSLEEGWAFDHETPAGRIMTVFSAPDYPQFGANPSNLACVAVLSSPSWTDPAVKVFSAAPRPKANPYVSHADVMFADEQPSGVVARALGSCLGRCGPTKEEQLQAI